MRSPPHQRRDVLPLAEPHRARANGVVAWAGRARARRAGADRARAARGAQSRAAHDGSAPRRGAALAPAGDVGAARVRSARLRAFVDALSQPIRPLEASRLNRTNVAQPLVPRCLRSVRRSLMMRLTEM